MGTEHYCYIHFTFSARIIREGSIGSGAACCVSCSGISRVGHQSAEPERVQLYNIRQL
jgi:hypothetical protein